MNKNLVSSFDCYEGIYTDKDEEEYITYGNYSDLSNDENINDSSIRWSDILWEEEKEHFYNMIKNEKEKYEKRYNTEVLAIALIGRLGFWNGTVTGGKITEIDKLLSIDVDDIEVSLTSDGTILINGYHHDGTHRLNIYFLTENNMKKAKIYNTYGQYESFNSFKYKEFENIYKYLKPLKMSKSSEYYNYDYYCS